MRMVKKIWKLHGEWGYYHENGYPQQKGNYKRGKKNGDWLVDKDGNASGRMTTVKYKNGMKSEWSNKALKMLWEATE